MNIVLYIIIFVIGTLLGSIYAKILKRVSKGKKAIDIHSFCSNCGKKLGFFEKMPILSYLLLRGKCKNCKKEIDTKYIILEFLTGVLFLAAACSLHINIMDISFTNVISFIFIILYFSYIILTSGADKQNRNMPATFLAYGIVIALVYIIYSAITEITSLYANIVYLVIMVVLLLVNILNTKKRAQSSYVIDLLTMLLIMLIFTGEMICIATIAGTLLAIALYILIKKIKKVKSQKNKTVFASNIKIVYIMGILNILAFLALINIYG